MTTLQCHDLVGDYLTLHFPRTGTRHEVVFFRQGRRVLRDAHVALWGRSTRPDDASDHGEVKLSMRLFDVRDKLDDLAVEGLGTSKVIRDVEFWFVRVNGEEEEEEVKLVYG